MSKRARNGADQELFESFAALLRQSASRAMERLKMQRVRNDRSNTADGRFFDNRSSSAGASTFAGNSSNNGPAPSSSSSSVKPIDTLVIQWAMYYLNLQTVPANHYVRLAQEVVTASPDRVLQPRFFAKVNLPQLCEGLVAEHTASVMEDTLKDIDEFVDTREIFGEWLAERVTGGGGGDDYLDNDDEMDAEEDGETSYHGRVWKSEDQADDDEENRQHPRSIAAVDLASILYEALAFWLRTRDFLHALSRGSANAFAFKLKPRYERELMTVLHDLASTAKRSPAVAPAAAQGESTDAAPLPKVKHLPDNENGSGGVIPAATAKTEWSVKVEPDAEALEEGGGGDQARDAPLDTAAMLAAAAASAAAADDADEEMEEAYDGVNSSDACKAEGSKRKGETAAEADYLPTGEMRDATATLERRRQKRNVATAVLADSLALAHVKKGLATTTSTTAATAEPHRGVLVSETLREKANGIDPAYYAMVHARLGVIVSRDWLRSFELSAAVPPPPLTVAQKNTQERDEANRRTAASAGYSSGGSIGLTAAPAIGVALDFVPDDRYFQRVLAEQHDSVGEDEEIYKEEVVDYYLRRQQRQRQQQWQQQQQQASAAGGRAGKHHGNRGQGNMNDAGDNNNSAPQPLVKPHRYCKVKTGYTWTQYNRTHYDSRTNPPPRTILWYEFTLFYPALVNAKRDMRNIFHIEDTPKGPSDDYCLLVFSVGPPYEDVAYRIVRKQWDTRRGGVRISFDATGKYKLFFRFTNSNYRR